MVGIVGYGAYVPQTRIKTEDIARVWQKNPEEIKKSLGILEKAVPDIDEDSVTLAITAAQGALSMSGKNASDIDLLLVGSESHPYAVNPTSTIVGEFLGVGNDYLAADLEFACKAATAAVSLISGLVASGNAQYGLAIGADTAQSKPHDVLEYTAGAGSAALLLGGKKQEIIAELTHQTSYSSDTPDFWRRDGMKYPSHGGRFTGEPAYFTHVVKAGQKLLTQSNMKPQDFDYCVFHSPNGKFPLLVAKRLGFSKEQLIPSYITPEIGNPYSAAALINLALVLDIATPGQKIFLVSYGSGAGSDAFIFQTTAQIAKRKPLGLRQQIQEKKYIDYPTYLKRMKII